MMYVQDIKLPGINITAEISDEEANEFEQLCQIFATDKSHEKIIDKFMHIKKIFEAELKTSHANCESNVTVKKHLSDQSTSNNLLNLVTQNLNDLKLEQAKLSKTNIIIDSLKSMKKPEITEISMTIKLKMDELLTRTKKRRKYESAIIRQLTLDLESSQCVKSLVRIGSTVYGFGESETNLNLLALTGLNISKCFIQQFIIIENLINLKR